MDKELHIFTAISKKACEKSMCWNLTCTTCGSMDLMHEYSSLIPTEKDLSRFGHNNNLKDQEALLGAVKNMSIDELMKESCFPDWLGHIGLLLSACEQIEKRDKILTQMILPQFIDLTNDDSRCHRELLRIQKTNRPLYAQDLEMIEAYIKRGLLTDM